MLKLSLVIGSNAFLVETDEAGELHNAIALAEVWLKAIADTDQAVIDHLTARLRQQTDGLSATIARTSDTLTS